MLLVGIVPVPLLIAIVSVIKMNECPKCGGKVEKDLWGYWCIEPYCTFKENIA